jgi:hypothetical protein
MFGTYEDQSMYGVMFGHGWGGIFSALGSSNQLGYYTEWYEPEPPEGWHNWIGDGPPPRKLIRLWREEWETPKVCYPEDIHPEMNVCGLWWQLTGIAKESE